MRIVTKLTIGYEIMVILTLLITLLGWRGMQTVLTLAEERTRIQEIQATLLTVRLHTAHLLHQQDETSRLQTDEALATLLAQARQERSRHPRDAAWTSPWDDLLQLVQAHITLMHQTNGRDLPALDRSADRMAQALTDLGQEKHRNLSAFLDRAGEDFLAGMLLTMGLAGLAVVLVMRSLRRSIRSGILFAEGVAKGNLSTPIEYHSRDELGILLASLQQMGKELVYFEQQHLRAHMSRIALSAMIETSMEPLSIEDQLRVVLQIIYNIPWLNLLDKGGVFLTDERTGDLQLVVDMNLDAGVRQTCQRVAAGHCLCGLALTEARFLYAPAHDPRHVIQYPGMQPHSHYCVPIFSRGKVTGVMMFHLDPHHHAHPEAEALLTTMANTVAGILERKRMEEQLKHLAHHDMLTGLPNRVLFMEHLEQAMTLTTRMRKKLAVMLIDLDRFKQVNDTFGHATGDQLLIQTGQRIKACLRASDMVSRLGGDEFAVILLDVMGPDDAGLVADKIVKTLTEPFCIVDHHCHIGASIGISLFPDHGPDKDTLLVRADEAMYGVKARGRNGFQVYP